MPPKCKKLAYSRISIPTRIQINQKAYKRELARFIKHDYKSRESSFGTNMLNDLELKPLQERRKHIRLTTWNARHFGTVTNRHLCETFRYQDKSAFGQFGTPIRQIGTCVFFKVVLAVALFWSLFNQNFLYLLSYKFFPADFRW